ncbi:Leucine rich repeat-containing protein [Pseudobutyrivibrio sp. YE44]|uniref:leucine-rich repeat protein n=1 Tax=Pseudobutyrivibrio sp. YE44 TaxID=1520802 RepID=UPI00089206EC|nr:leucine-rich repeat protein [Pseudobutyrivibrio sp. YE44]SDB35651.1 Leucine rich repeat-containing protein [Pseudobutyrivibrio sp. YE44]
MKRKMIILGSCCLCIIIIIVTILVLSMNGIIGDYKYEFNTDERWTIRLTEYTGNDTKVVLSTHIGPFKIKYVTKETFSNSKTVEKIVVPPDIEYKSMVIGNNVLKELEYEYGRKRDCVTVVNCKNFEKVVFPDGLEEIVRDYLACPKLNSVVIPSSVKKIVFDFDETGYSEAHKNDKYYVVGDGVLLFYHGSKEEIVIPEGVKSINHYCVIGKENEDETKIVYLPDSLNMCLEFGYENEVIFYGNNQDISYDDLYDVKSIIKAPKGAPVEQFCKDNDIEFQESTEEEEAIRKEKTEAAASEITYQENEKW